MFDPRSILLHIDGGQRVAMRVQLARQLAETFGAKVVAQHAATPFLLRYPMAIEGSVAAVTLVSQADDDAREAARLVFETAAAGSGALTWSPQHCDGLEFTTKALYADLVIVGQRDAEDPADGELPPDFVQNLVIDSGKPVLVLPYAGAVAPMPSVVMIAWKETREAARAVAAALPWLRRAQRVSVACFDEDAAGAVGRLSAWLAAHGVTNVQHSEGPATGEAGELLLSRAADVGAELLVMGCYGHSRSREWVLGGASRTLLRSMTLPVLMVH
jgi:nucleotide-binding universal stress UspA family protein